MNFKKFATNNWFSVLLANLLKNNSATLFYHLYQWAREWKRWVARNQVESWVMESKKHKHHQKNYINVSLFVSKNPLPLADSNNVTEEMKLVDLDVRGSRSWFCVHFATISPLLLDMPFFFSLPPLCRPDRVELVRARVNILVEFRLTWIWLALTVCDDCCKLLPRVLFFSRHSQMLVFIRWKICTNGGFAIECKREGGNRAAKQYENCISFAPSISQK